MVLYSVLGKQAAKIQSGYSSAYYKNILFYE